MSPDHLIRLFDDQVPEAFQVALLRMLAKAYRKSSDYVSDRYERPEAEYMLGHERRVQIEMDLRALTLAHEFSEFTAVVKANETGSHKYTEVRCGNVVITVSAVSELTQLPRRANFRKSLAKSSQLQLQFDDEPTPAPAPESAEDLYALLVHHRNSDSETPFELSFAEFIFPLEVGYHEARVDLMRRYAFQTQANTTDTPKSAPAPVEHIPDDLPLAPRTEDRSKESGTA